MLINYTSKCTTYIDFMFILVHTKHWRNMVSHWCGNLFKKVQLFGWIWCIHQVHPLTMVFVLIIPVGSTPVPGNRSQKWLRKRQKAEASLQESSCHTVISFDIWMSRTNLHGLKLVPSLQRTSLCIAKSYCWRSIGSLVAAEQSLPFPPSWNGTYSILLLSDHHSHHDSLLPIFI